MLFFLAALRMEYPFLLLITKVSELREAWVWHVEEACSLHNNLKNNEENLIVLNER